MNKLLNGVFLTLALVLLSACETLSADEVFKKAEELENEAISKEEVVTFQYYEESVAEKIEKEKDEIVDIYYKLPNTTDKSEKEGSKAWNAEYEKVNVVYVIDGDTIEVRNAAGDKHKVRLLLINTPESEGAYKDTPQPYATEAKNYTKKLLLNKNVWLEYDVSQTDQYGRTLAYVWLSKDLMANELLLKEGLAHVAVYKPDVKYQSRFELIESAARSHKIGMWNK